ncbi:hypothetical protein [Hymenobacter cellulosivorans]|uniref:DUF4369 domain-containing protein n=1 Tax=Hymenobacter cellulosivorans TaxID=2932249 RepID=A0ABY4F980_9BACT|nr:hypothetical protein [Hymenobacter cellulosivorans]UOQ52593.1 hypothetical protein MUN80_22930 [Hymenobacter cellulosivorans]
MRFVVLCLISLLMPQLLRAQSLFNTFEPGSYVLVNNPTQRVQGNLKLRGCTELLVKNPGGYSATLGLADVQSFRLGQQQFIKAGGFPVEQGLDGDTIDQAFVEQVDSGRVVLMRLHFITAGPTLVGTSGLPMGSSKSYVLYLLRRAGEDTITPLPASSKRFREALLPYLTARPDLAKLVADKLITTENLPKLIHALNAGAPTQ